MADSVITTKVKADIFKELKGTGFDPKVVKRVVQLRRQDRAERTEFETVLDLYMHAIGEVA